MKPPRVLVSGPLEHLDEWCAAARSAGWEPIACTSGERLPECELVFFANPSDVRMWTELGSDDSAQRALCIGPTTLQALLAEKSLPFFDIISLPEPTSSAFAAALQHIDLSTTP